MNPTQLLEHHYAVVKGTADCKCTKPADNSVQFSDECRVRLNK